MEYHRTSPDCGTWMMRGKERALGSSAWVGAVFLFIAAFGLLSLFVQYAVLRLHLRGSGLRRLPPGAAFLPGGARVPSMRAPPGEPSPGISILKPLCGGDDELDLNLASFAALDYPRYEVLLGVRSHRDPAIAAARAAVLRWPDRMRLVIQAHEPGRNPKVNQLVALSRAARFGIVVVSDSNVRVAPDYLAKIAAELRDPDVGLVTHPVCGAGERRLGSILENLHLAGSVAPATVATHRLIGRAIVVGKSMAMRKADLERLGGFEAVKDVLAEDHLLALLVRRRLGKRVAVSRRPVVNVNRDRRVRDFWGRYARWSVLQRKLVGGPAYSAQLVLDPVLLALLAVAAWPVPHTWAAFALTCALKIAVDGACARALRPPGFPLLHLALIPLKDLLFGAALLQGLLTDEVEWRGNRLRVLPGTYLAPPEEEAEPVGAET